jgi:hypothetical protein
MIRQIWQIIKQDARQLVYQIKAEHAKKEGMGQDFYEICKINVTDNIRNWLEDKTDVFNSMVYQENIPIIENAVGNIGCTEESHANIITEKLKRYITTINFNKDTLSILTRKYIKDKFTKDEMSKVKDIEEYYNESMKEDVMDIEKYRGLSRQLLKTLFHVSQETQLL